MKRLDLSDWANIGELGASIAVVISLFFVVHSINMNTRATQSSNDNFIVEIMEHPGTPWDMEVVGNRTAEYSVRIRVAQVPFGYLKFELAKYPKKSPQRASSRPCLLLK